jgi:hypothetical protein
MTCGFVTAEHREQQKEIAHRASKSGKSLRDVLRNLVLRGVAKGMAKRHWRGMAPECTIGPVAAMIPEHWKCSDLRVLDIR